MSNYYPDSPDITAEEIALLDHFLAGQNLLPENTRIRKLKGGDFEVLVASGVRKPPVESIDVGSTTAWQLNGKLQGKKVEIVYGDHQEEMAKISLHIKKAGLSTADERQKMMMDEYAKSFSTGSLKAFKESQKHWVQNLSPIVESNIGFIESYRDPSGIRSEWEGFGKNPKSYFVYLAKETSEIVSIVNQERTKVFSKLVEGALMMIPKLPWSSEFERDHFVAPDFTSLEVLNFATSGFVLLDGKHAEYILRLF